MRAVVSGPLETAIGMCKRANASPSLVRSQGAQLVLETAVR